MLALAREARPKRDHVDDQRARAEVLGVAVGIGEQWEDSDENGGWRGYCAWVNDKTFEVMGEINHCHSQSTPRGRCQSASSRSSRCWSQRRQRCLRQSGSDRIGVCQSRE